MKIPGPFGCVVHSVIFNYLQKTGEFEELLTFRKGSWVRFEKKKPKKRRIPLLHFCMCCCSWPNQHLISQLGWPQGFCRCESKFLKNYLTLFCSIEQDQCFHIWSLTGKKKCLHFRLLWSSTKWKVFLCNKHKAVSKPPAKLTLFKISDFTK